MVKMRLLCMCLAALLLAPLAQAHGLDAEPPLDVESTVEAAGAAASSAATDVTQAVAEGEAEADREARATQAEADREARATQAEAEARRAEAEATAAELQIEILQTLQEGAAEAEDRLRPGHAIVADAQSQMDEILLPDEDEPAPEPEASPRGGAAVVNAWPEYAQPVLILGGAAAGFGVLAWLLGQTATVGAGAAGTAAARDGRRFLPFASPLFTRFERDTVLGHPKREAIYGQIIGKPGITLQDLCEVSGLSRTAVTHHLRLLEQQHLIVSKRMGRSRHFFENGGRYGRNQKDAYAVLHNERSKEIHAFIASNPGSIQKDLCGAFAIQASVAHWHVKRLLEANLVEAVRQGRTVSYFPAGETPQPAYA